MFMVAKTRHEDIDKKSQLWKVKTSLPLVPFWHSQQLPAFWSLELRWNYLTSGLQSSPHHTLLPELDQSCQIQPCKTMHTNMSYQEDTRYHVLINCVILALCKKELDRLSLELLEQYPVAAMVYSHRIKSGSFFYLKFSRRARILGWLNSACAPWSTNNSKSNL
jgi:hypothetical protein